MKCNKIKTKLKAIKTYKKIENGIHIKSMNYLKIRSL
jgi:hypothetical protein